MKRAASICSIRTRTKTRCWLLRLFLYHCGLLLWFVAHMHTHTQKKRHTCARTRTHTQTHTHTYAQIHAHTRTLTTCNVQFRVARPACMQCFIPAMHVMSRSCLVVFDHRSTTSETPWSFISTGTSRRSKGVHYTKLTVEGWLLQQGDHYYVGLWLA